MRKVVFISSLLVSFFANAQDDLLNMLAEDNEPIYVSYLFKGTKVVNGQCVGKFIRNPMYEKGEDILDFNLQHYSKVYRVPSFKLSLDVIATDITNSFNSENISEDSFNL